MDKGMWALQNNKKYKINKYVLLQVTCRRQNILSLFGEQKIV